MKNDFTERARRYVLAMPPSISGAGGHLAAYKAALALMKGFELSELEALPLISQWNEACQPPWREVELRRKLREAAKAQVADGYLLGGNGCGRRPNRSPASSVPPRPPDRSNWPTFRKGERSDLELVASIRKLPLDAVFLAHTFGVLRFCHWRNHDCFALLNESGTFAQLRRLDGEAWMAQNGERRKAYNLPGSRGNFIGTEHLGIGCPVLLVEGCIGYLEATAAILLSNIDWTGGPCGRGWAALAAVAGNVNFPASLLARLSGRRVLIVGDRDKTGSQSVGKWLAQLHVAGCIVSAKRTPAPWKDLGDAIAVRNELNLDFLNLFTM